MAGLLPLARYKPVAELHEETQKLHQVFYGIKKRLRLHFEFFKIKFQHNQTPWAFDPYFYLVIP